MTHPPNWDHIDDQNTRLVLARVTTDREKILEAISFAFECIDKDVSNEDVTDAVWSARSAAYGEAAESWTDGDMHETVEALRRLWSI